MLCLSDLKQYMAPGNQGLTGLGERYPPAKTCRTRRTLLSMANPSLPGCYSAVLKDFRYHRVSNTLAARSGRGDDISCATESKETQQGHSEAPN